MGKQNAKGPARKFRNEDLLEVVREKSNPVVTSPQLAEDVPVSKTTVLRRLDELVEEGKVNRMDVGRGAVWWADAEEELVEVDDREEEFVEDDAPAPDVEDNNEEIVVASDGGLTPGAQIIIERLPLLLETAQERKAIQESAGELSKGIGLVFAMVIASIVHGMIVTLPSYLVAAFGFVLLYGLMLSAFGLARIGLVSIGWYNQSDTSESNPQHA